MALYGTNHTVKTTLTPKTLDRQNLTVSGLIPGQTYFLKVWTMDESSNVSEPSILVSAAAKKLPPTAPDKPDSLFIENAPGDINLDIVDSTPEFSAIFNDANISDSGVFYAIEVELTTNTLIDEFDDNNSSAYSFNALSGVAESNGSFFATSTNFGPLLMEKFVPEY